MLRAAVWILPVDVMASRQGSGGCCSWLCCCCRRGAREKSPLLSGGGQGGKKEASEQPTSGLQVMASSDGQSETQQLELTVQESSHDEDQEEVAQPTSQKDGRRSRTTSVSYEPPVKDPATSTTFVRGSSGRSSWRMVPHPKRESQISVKEEGSPQPEAPADTETGVGTPEPVAMAPETPPPPPKDYTLVPSYEVNQSEPSEEGDEEEEVEREAEREMVHTSSFSFTARDGQLKST